MDHSISNIQESLAELLILNDIQNNFASYEAILCIKRWKFIIRIQGIASRITAEADENIRKNFLTYIPFKQVLMEEGDYYAGINN